jgi:hypothetical protein
MVCLVLPVLSTVRTASGQQAEETKPKVSQIPLTAEQLAVYRTVLQGWMNDGPSAINLAVETVPLPTSGVFDASACSKGLDLEPVLPADVHRFRAEDLPQVGSGKINLVDPERQRKEVAENDPGKAIREGRSVDEAVRNGFAHGLVTLSEIRFDKEHKRAIVSYSFVCGSLCGNGGAAVMEKIDGGWRLKSSCSDWIS